MQLCKTWEITINAWKREEKFKFQKKNTGRRVLFGGRGVQECVWQSDV